MTTLITILAKLDSSSEVTSDFVDDESLSIKECVQALRSMIRRQQTTVRDSAKPAYISLRDAITALEEVTIDRRDIRKPASENAEPGTSALIAHTTLARRFQRCYRKKRHRDEKQTDLPPDPNVNSDEDDFRNKKDKKPRQNYKASSNHPTHGSKNRNKAVNKPHIFNKRFWSLHPRP